MSSSDPIGLDAFPVSSDEACELTVHHLKLAAMFFMNTPEDGGRQLKEEIARQIESRSVFAEDDHVAHASKEFLAVLIDHFEEGKDTPPIDRVFVTKKELNAMLHAEREYLRGKSAGERIIKGSSE